MKWHYLLVLIRLSLASEGCNTSHAYAHGQRARLALAVLKMVSGDTNHGVLAVTNLGDFFSDFLNQISQKLLSNFKINYEQQRCFFTERA